MYFFESYRASKRTVQSDPSISFVYDSFKCTWRLSYKILKKKSLLDPYYTTEMDIHIQKAYCKSTRHTEWELTVLFVYYLKCRWSSSHKNTSLFDPHMTPGGQNEKPGSLLHICKICSIISYSINCLLLKM